MLPTANSSRQAERREARIRGAGNRRVQATGFSISTGVGLEQEQPEPQPQSQSQSQLNEKELENVKGVASVTPGGKRRRLNSYHSIDSATPVVDNALQSPTRNQVVEDAFAGTTETEFPKESNDLPPSLDNSPEPDNTRRKRPTLPSRTPQKSRHSTVAPPPSIKRSVKKSGYKLLDEGQALAYEQQESSVSSSPTVSTSVGPTAFADSSGEIEKSGNLGQSTNGENGIEQSNGMEVDSESDGDAEEVAEVQPIAEAERESEPEVDEPHTALDVEVEDEPHVDAEAYDSPMGIGTDDEEDTRTNDYNNYNDDDDDDFNDNEYEPPAPKQRKVIKTNTEPKNQTTKAKAKTKGKGKEKAKASNKDAQLAPDSTTDIPPKGKSKPQAKETTEQTKPRVKQKRTENDDDDDDEVMTLTLQKLPTSSGGIKRINAIDVVSQICSQIFDRFAEQLSSQKWASNAFSQYREILNQRFYKLVDAIDVNYSIYQAMKRAEQKRNNLRERLLRIRQKRANLQLEMEQVREGYQKDQERSLKLRQVSAFADDIQALRQLVPTPGPPTESVDYADLTSVQALVNSEWGSYERLKALTDQLASIDKKLSF